MTARRSGRVGAALAMLAVVAAGPPTAPPPAASSAVAGGFRTNANPTQRLAASLAQIHMATCTPVFQQAGAFIFENGEANFVVQPLGPDANRWPTAVTIESTHPPGANNKMPQTRLTTLIIAPAGTCSGLYTQVIYWPEACAALKARVFAAFGPEKPLLAHVMVSEANPGLQLYLTPAGTGCVSVKKELIG